MKRILIPILLGLSVLTLGAQTVEPAENAGSVPVKHWEFDYYNYSISSGHETLYMNFTMALRYNFDTPLVDVGGEFTVGATPHDRHDPTELNKGDILKRIYIMLSPVAHYNFRRGKNASFYAGLGIGSCLGTREVFCRLYGRCRWEHFRGIENGEVTVGPSVSLTFGGGRKD